MINSSGLFLNIFIDRAKKLWAELSWGRWITTSLAGIGGFLLAFVYGLVGLTDTITIGGQVFAGLAVAAGSSCINEILEKVHGAE